MNILKNAFYKTKFKLNCGYYSVKNFIYPHNVLKISHVDKSWCDRDILMFHAAFQVLVDFVELEQEYVQHDISTPKRYTDLSAMKNYIEQQYNTEKGRAYFREPLMYVDEIADAQTAELYNRAKKILELYEWYVTKQYEDCFAADNWQDMIDEKMIELIKCRRWLWT